MEAELCKKTDCHYQQEHHKKKWSWAHFKVGIAKIVTSPAFWTFIIVTTLFIIFAPKDQVGFWIAYCATAGCCIFHKEIAGLLNRANVNVNANVGVNKNT